MSNLTPEIKEYIANTLLGSCSNVWFLVEELEIEEGWDADLVVKAAAEENGVWQCDICSWWFEEADIVITDQVECLSCHDKE